ncbi:DUF4232 domain-containing protein [Nocardia sp. NPDC088792]|uniref:DUF4232 domain-containing protein n=1 Tax=Nocardia sp. NPDC088792 TaxID=3364332 RepID=UPI0038025C65
MFRTRMWSTRLPIVLACAALASAACSSTSTTTAPSTTAAAVASTSASAAPSTSAAALAQCAGADLKVTIPGWGDQPAPAMVVGEIDFTNVSAASCTLQGFPGVALMTKTGESDDFDRETFKQPIAVTVAPGQTVSAKTSGGLGIYDPDHPDSNSTTLTVDPDRLLVTPPNTTDTVSFPWPWPGKKVQDLFGSTHLRPYVYPVGVQGN